jgi:hypothetical protein
MTIIALISCAVVKGDIDDLSFEKEVTSNESFGILPSKRY